jgi:large subunit ribosomal protein L7e
MENLEKSSNGLIYKTETILKNRTKLKELRERKSRQKLKNIIEFKNRPKLKDEIKRPEDFVTEYREKQKNYNQYKKRLHKDLELLNIKENDLIFIIRIRGDKNLSDNQKKLFKILNLKKQHEGSIFVVDKNLKKSISCLENYIIYGFINKKNFKDLITKRGYLKYNNGLHPIKSNKLVEDVLGEKNIICVEDIVSEIFSKGENFNFIKKVLRTFKLNKPTEGYGNKASRFVNDGAWGFHGDKLNLLIEKMI